MSVYDYYIRNSVDTQVTYILYNMNFSRFFAVVCCVHLASGGKLGIKLQPIRDTGKKNTTEHHKIVGGDDSAPGAWPHQAQLLLNGNHRCGGTLIHPCYVLTAKHCINGIDKSAFRVRLGEHDTSDTDTFMTQHTLIRIISHPTIDVALLHITPSADLSNPRISTIPMATSDPAVGTMATVTGWGQTQSMMSGTLATVLQEVTIPIASVPVCNADLPGTVRPHEICAGTATGTYANACHGDSGGPLVVETTPGSGSFELVGIVSWGNGGCPSNHHYAVYVSAADVRSWVMQYVPSVNPPPGTNCHCINPAIKYDNTPVPAHYDGANCYLGPARAGCQHEAEETKSFIHENRFYIKSSEAILCPAGSFDSCNCRIMTRPAGGFINNNVFYHPLPASGTCPPGHTINGAHCKMSAPWATTAFIYGNSFYTTARKQCAEPSQFSFDSQNCYYQDAPPPNPFVWDNGYYARPSGGSCPSGSSWDGAHCFYRKAPWATTAFLYGGKFYSTPRRQCYEGSFDGANCYIMRPPVGATAFLYANKYYYSW